MTSAGEPARWSFPAGKHPCVAITLDIPGVSALANYPARTKIPSSEGPGPGETFAFLVQRLELDRERSKFGQGPTASG
jgi:hypothetical protein